MKTTTGSIVNRMTEGKQFGEVEVGMGATEMCYTDRHAYTVQRVISPTRVIVTQDIATRVDDNGASDEQVYSYESTPLVEGKRERMCCNPYSWGFEDGSFVCKHRAENGTCEGCAFFKMRRETNGIELRKCKDGWKQAGTDTYFRLGVRKEYYDFSF